VKKTPNGVRSSASKPLITRNLRKEREELALLQGQVDELEKKLVEKEESLELAQNSIDQMITVNEALEDVKHQLEEKELMVMSASSELNEAKVMCIAPGILIFLTTYAVPDFEQTVPELLM
jgi:DNA repair exonuclease SbcCD ATPase subunit